jgi:hypothetical protein
MLRRRAEKVPPLLPLGQQRRIRSVRALCGIDLSSARGSAGPARGQPCSPALTCVSPASWCQRLEAAAAAAAAGQSCR